MKELGNLVWMDLEMTGLDPDRDKIIEIATIITDAGLNIIEEGPVLAVKQSESVLGQMDEWNQRVHKSSGLVARVHSSNVTTAQAEQATLEFIKHHIIEGRSPLCGNSICQDRRFLYRYMPKISAFLHYRNVDVSTIKELVARWSPAIVSGFEKKAAHRALDDIRESIEELQYYRRMVFKI